MRDARSHPPLVYRAFNALCKPLAAAGLLSFRLDEESVCRAAIKQTGLTGFGDSHYRQGLLQLLESAEQDANLHPVGRQMARTVVINYLVQRLRLMETRNKEPEIFEEPLHPPLLITRLGRSGTTFLHNMLALDPAHRALPQWWLYRAVTPEIDLCQMTSLTLRWYELWSMHNLAFRAEHPDTIYDVYYDALVSDPIGTVQGIYSHFGLSWTDVYASELARYIEENPKGKHGQHRYAASDYGLTEAEIARRLRPYIQHFGF